MPTITAITTEVQVRCNALTGSSTVSQVIDCAIAAKKVELAGGVLTRTTLNTQIQRVNDLSGGGSTIEDLIVLAAMQPVTSTAAGKTLKVQEFLTSGSWTRPAGVDSVEVLLVGGGGGGGGLGLGAGAHGGGGSGGGGGVYKRIIPVTSITVGSTVTVTIGAGGSAGTTAAGGGAGGNSTFGSLLTAGGGGGGDSVDSVFTVFAGGSGVATSGGGAIAGNTTIYIGGLGGGAGGSPAPSVSHEFAATMTSMVYARYSRTGVLTHFPGTTGLSNNQVTANSNAWLAVSVSAVGAPSYERGAGGGVYTPTTVTSAYPFNINGACGSGGGTVLNAVANSGGGGATHWVSSQSGSYSGGAGGSGYCLVTWWE